MTWLHCKWYLFSWGESAGCWRTLIVLRTTESETRWIKTRGEAGAFNSETGKRRIFRFQVSISVSSFSMCKIKLYTETVLPTHLLTFPTSGSSLCHRTVLGAHNVSFANQAFFFHCYFPEYCSLVLKTGLGEKKKGINRFSWKDNWGEMGKQIAGCCCKMLSQGQSLPWFSCPLGTG